MRKIYVVLFVASLSVEHANADWSGCASSLHQLSSSAQTAESDAQDVEQAEQDYEDQKSRYDQCRRYPDTYDLYSDGCATLARRARNAKDDLDSAIDQLQSAMSEVESSYNDVSNDCSGSLAVTSFTGMCATMRELRGKYTEAELFAACKTQITEALCKICLGQK